MALLTILRIYAIIRAITYYRRLRRLNEPESSNEPIFELAVPSVDRLGASQAKGSLNGWAPLSLEPSYHSKPAPGHFRSTPEPNNGGHRQRSRRLSSSSNYDSHAQDPGRFHCYPNQTASIGHDQAGKFIVLQVQQPDSSPSPNPNPLNLNPNPSSNQHTIAAQVHSVQQLETDHGTLSLVRSNEAPTRRRHASADSLRQPQSVAELRSDSIVLVPAHKRSRQRQRAVSSAAATQAKPAPLHDACESEPTAVGASRRLSRVDRADLDLVTVSELRSAGPSQQSSLEALQQVAHVSRRSSVQEVVGRRQTREQQRQQQQQQQQIQQHDMLSLQNLFVAAESAKVAPSGNLDTVRVASSSLQRPTFFTLQTVDKRRTQKAPKAAASSAERPAKYKLVARYRQMSSLDSTASAQISADSSETSCEPEDSDGSEQQVNVMQISGMRQSEELLAASLASSPSKEAKALLQQQLDRHRRRASTTSDNNLMGKCELIEFHVFASSVR